MTAGPAVGGRPTSNGTMAQWAQRLQRMQGSSRKHLTELALYAARIELAPCPQGSPPAGEQA